MKGLELARGFYEEYGAPMLHEKFPELEGLVAVGLVGGGSECFGYDDEISADHDFEPGFCLFLPGEERVDRQSAFQLERAYARLPREYGGVKRLQLSPVGGSRHGVIRTADFYRDKVGRADGRLNKDDWLSIPDYALAEAVNGEVFRDDLGEFSAIRASLSAMPEDVRRKRLAGQLLLMAQAGQYNYRRCLSHGESGAAQLAVTEFVKSAMSAAFLLSGRYMPYYKWSFRALRSLPQLGELAEALEFLLTTDNDGDLADSKALIIEDVASAVIEELLRQELTRASCNDLEKHAYSVNDAIADADIRNRHILCAV